MKYDNKPINDKDYELRIELATQPPTQAIKHMLYCRFLKCVLLNLVSNVDKNVCICTHSSYS